MDKLEMWKQHMQFILKKKKPNQKMNGRPKQILLHKRHTDGQQTHENMPNVTKQRNASQNYNEVSPYTGQNGHHQKILK